MPHIYKITSPSGKIYVGSTVNIARRFSEYKRIHCRGQHKLLNSLKKYGPSAHVFEILEECSETDMYRLEAEYGAKFDVLGGNGLNCNLPKNGDIYKSKSKEVIAKLRGKKRTDETKAKMSKAAMGNKNGQGVKLSEERKKKLSQLGKKATPETIAKLRVSHLGQKNANKGKKNIHTPEGLLKVKQARANQIFSPESLKKVTASKYKIVLNTQNGVYYDSVIDATASQDKWGYGHITQMLSGKKKNHSNLIYA